MVENLALADLVAVRRRYLACSARSSCVSHLSTCRFKMAQGWRAHLERDFCQNVNRSVCKLETNRRGIPRTLVVAKCDRSPEEHNAWVRRLQLTRKEMFNFWDGSLEPVLGAKTLDKHINLREVVTDPSRVPERLRGGPLAAVQENRVPSVRAGVKRTANEAAFPTLGPLSKQRVEFVDLCSDSE